MFLLGRQATFGLTLVAGVFSGCLTAGYGYMINRGYTNATVGLKVVKVFAMVFDAFCALFAAVTAMAVANKHKEIHQSLFSVSAFVGCLLDLLWFSLQCKATFQTFCDSDDSSYCKRKKLAVGFSVVIFLAVIIRGFASMTTFAFDVKRNSKPLTTTTTTSATSLTGGGTTTSSSKVQSLPKPTRSATVKTRALSTLHRLGSVRYGEDFGTEMKRTLLTGESSEDEIDRLDRLGEDEVGAASVSESDDEERAVGGPGAHRYAALDKQ